MSNYKPALIIITSDVLLMHDGVSLSPTSLIIEKCFTQQVIKNLNLGDNGYLILEILMAATIKIVDIYDSSLPISSKFEERVAWLHEKFDKIKFAQKCEALDVDSCLLKPLYDHALPTLVYVKPTLCGAVIGYEGKHCKVAFLRDDKTLEYKMNANITGPAAFSILTAETQSLATSYINGDVEIHNIPTNTQLFKKAIIVEIKEGGKLGFVQKDQDILKVANIRECIIPEKETVNHTLVAALKQLPNHQIAQFLVNLDNFDDLYALLQSKKSEMEINVNI